MSKMRFPRGIPLGDSNLPAWWTFIQRLSFMTIVLAASAIRSSDGQFNLFQLISNASSILPAGLNDVLGLAGGHRDSSPETLELIKKRGFIGEFYLTKSHDNKTPIAIYHIINPLADPKKLNRYPVLVAHGVTTDSSSMVANSDNQWPREPSTSAVFVEPQNDTSLALALANNNFDVWMADARGTNMNNHLISQELNPLEGQNYWNFTLDDQISYDLTAMLDFVLNQTHSDKLHYIGFSESTYFMFALLSSSPYYQSKLVSFVALAPVAYVTNIKGSTVSIFALTDFIPEQINGNFVPQLVSDTMGATIRKACNDPLLSVSICRLLFTTIAGSGSEEKTNYFYATQLKGTSIKAVRQFMQNLRQKRFGKYDYGRDINLRLYGQATPPDYDLGNIKTSGIILFRGSNDFLSDPTDQQLLLAKLGAKPYRDFNLSNYNHFDFLTSVNVVRDVNEPAVRLMFELSQAKASLENASSVLKDSQRASLPPPFKPVIVVKPDNSREVDFNTQLVSDLAQNSAATQAKAVAPFDTLPLLGDLQAALKPLLNLAG